MWVDQSGGVDLFMDLTLLDLSFMDLPLADISAPRGSILHGSGPHGSSPTSGICPSRVDMLRMEGWQASIPSGVLPPYDDLSSVCKLFFGTDPFHEGAFICNTPLPPTY